MEVNEALIDRLSELSKLEFSTDDKGKMVKDLNKMLEFVDKLNEVDTEGVEPLLFMNEDVNQWRADEEKPALGQKEALKNAPLSDSDYFKVPKVIDNK
ncbi:Asp-tRNA(Asn)/Glu-tRNA(Gln) amidotransferase subunit GatC [Luteibaculum oceani]|uniref:Aspartyl/glutamyl-tRNA(Asn/Gln) amidotransferase subunit C n=1 Tax=Luteibaculum oceani TaxID=1294296 RepID=A0A5C6UZX3_9FLAO|nr:Asp-tRNA(Asn)/Glu-tRNA(Gln) amidotransferase subunit GatC [Luteibaculum oceani]TXC78993.1 Asp-tRNA(Asn)/Glu-tRNA(Gln) amidotransferase subunit GatC [Luteibaculum oceani]